jgi:hypothetical protein
VRSTRVKPCRAFRISRAFPFVLAFLSLTSAQRGILCWVAKHRQHHMHADTEADLDSPVLRGLFYAHVGWIFEARNDRPDDIFSFYSVTFPIIHLGCVPAHVHGEILSKTPDPGRPSSGQPLIILSTFTTNFSRSNGLVMTSMPCSMRPLPTAALSA